MFICLFWITISVNAAKLIVVSTIKTSEQKKTIFTVCIMLIINLLGKSNKTMIICSKFIFDTDRGWTIVLLVPKDVSC